MKKILLIGNTVFIPIDYRNHITGQHKIMYMAGSVSGLLFSDGLYTEEEIRTVHSDIKEVEKGFLGINECYYHKPRAIKDIL
jgi:hypothetical protein